MDIKKTYWLPAQIMPVFETPHLNTLQTNALEMLNFYIQVFCFSLSWDDINGAFEATFLEIETDLTDDQAISEMENRIMNAIVYFMEVYGDLSDILARTLHWLRILPDGWVIADTCLTPLNNQTLVLEVNFTQDPLAEQVTQEDFGNITVYNAPPPIYI